MTTTQNKMEYREIDFTRIANDTNGNPRYVCHFLNFITDGDREGTDISGRYEIALRKARKIGGRKFHNKQYGGGIVFQSYNTKGLERKINEIRGWDNPEGLNTDY